VACNTDTIPRPEYPRPQMERDRWVNLNGKWEFEIDHGRSGRERRLPEAKALKGSIMVPFCPESRLSGIEHKDFMAAVWYRREFAVSEDWTSGRILLHFGAVDYDAEVWINGVSAGTHRGGYTPFTLDITALVTPGVNVVTVVAEDDVRTGLQPSGKQSPAYHSHGCVYTRTTGIWQTVWLECVPKTYLHALRYLPDPANSRVHIEARLAGDRVGAGLTGRADLADGVDSTGKAGLACGIDSTGRTGSAGRADSTDKAGLVCGIDSTDRVGSACGIDSTDRVGSACGADAADRADSAGQFGSVTQADPFERTGLVEQTGLVGQTGLAEQAASAMYRLVAVASYQGREVGRGVAESVSQVVNLSLDLSEVHLWGPGRPCLYDLCLELWRDDGRIDTVRSYFGLRTVSWDDTRIYINGDAVFQRLVLDQGFYPDGIYTAPTDADLKRDIEISMAMGFNGARLHEKLFEPRFLYWADQMGYLVWGEYANWGLDITSPMGLERFLPEWLEAVERDFNHPSIIGWCPFNETWSGRQGAQQDDEVLRIVYRTTKMIDPTRPVIDTSGNFHVETDIFDVHDYEQNVELFVSHYEPMKTGGDAYVTHPARQKYGGQPYFVSEYGGIWWNPGDESGWGYGSRPASEEEFIARYKGLTETLLKHPRICGFCYTQLYDVEQEVNGLYSYDRRAKFDPRIIRAINSQRAAIEK
jgi:beta-galactosidase/beta-glucuronidase